MTDSHGSPYFIGSSMPHHFIFSSLHSTFSFTYFCFMVRRNVLAPILLENIYKKHFSFSRLPVIDFSTFPDRKTLDDTHQCTNVLLLAYNTFLSFNALSCFWKSLLTLHKCISVIILMSTYCSLHRALSFFLVTITFRFLDLTYFSFSFDR